MKYVMTEMQKQSLEGYFNKLPYEVAKDPMNVLEKLKPMSEGEETKPKTKKKKPEATPVAPAVESGVQRQG